MKKARRIEIKAFRRKVSVITEVPEKTPTESRHQRGGYPGNSSDITIPETKATVRKINENKTRRSK
jgi:hypothetical protein